MGTTSLSDAECRLRRELLYRLAKSMDNTRRKGRTLHRVPYTPDPG